MAFLLKMFTIIYQDQLGSVTYFQNDNETYNSLTLHCQSSDKNVRFETSGGIFHNSLFNKHQEIS